MKWYSATIFSLCIMTVASTITGQSPHFGGPKHVIGSIYAGFFANFFMAINHIGWCARNNQTPVVYWGGQCPYYQQGGYRGTFNAWEYYFAPASQASYVHGEFVDNSYWAPDGSGLDYRTFTCNEMIRHRAWAHDVICKYVRIRKEIKEKIDSFYTTYFAGKKTVGIHLRGTDKHNEVQPVSIYAIVAEAKKYVCDQYFIATDDQNLLYQAIQLLPKPVVYYDSVRSSTGAAVHIVNNGNRAELGEQVLIETVLLSKCNTFIHTCSNVSTAVHFFNPKIDYVLMRAS